MKEIKCDCKLTVKVDDDDYFILSQFKWHTVFSSGNAYAAHQFLINDKRVSVSMHRLLIKIPDGYIVDHIDGDGLNNQRSNLRICTKQENAMNARSDKTGSSKYKGVILQKGRRSYHAIIQGKYIGSFIDEIEAAKAYDKKAAELFGEFARLNFPIK
jgi:hypothetical protein